MNESLIGYLGLVVFIGGFGFLAIKYVRHFKQLQRTYVDLGMKWPSLTREQILAEGLIKGLHKSFASVFKIWGIILFSRPSSPALKASLRAVRLTLIAFILFPFLLAFLLILTVMLVGYT